jgi:hypothetical protein
MYTKVKLYLGRWGLVVFPVLTGPISTAEEGRLMEAVLAAAGALGHEVTGIETESPAPAGARPMAA